jgi:hypothetical protein
MEGRSGLKIGFPKPIPNRKDSPPYEAYSLRPIDAIPAGAARGIVPEAVGGVRAVDGEA